VNDPPRPAAPVPPAALAAAGQAAARVLLAFRIPDPDLADAIAAEVTQAAAPHIAAAGREDPRDYGLTSDDLHAAADRLYDTDDSRLDAMTGASQRFSDIRSRLRALADAIGRPA
jgi:hypothetical protein